MYYSNKKKSRKEISTTIGVSQSTLCREIKRNDGKYSYHHKQTQTRADGRKRRFQNYRSLTTGIRAFIRKKMTEEQWSPAQIVGYLRRQGEKSVCVETVYTYIRKDKANGGELWKHCRHRLKHLKRPVSAPYKAVPDRTMIDERPAGWDESTPGDFEMDTIIGKDGKGPSSRWWNETPTSSSHANCPTGKMQKNSPGQSSSCCSLISVR